MSKYLIAGIVSLCLLVAGAIPTYLVMHSQVEALTDDLDRANATLQSTTRALRVEKDEKARLQRDYDDLARGLTSALKKNQGWADTPVPDAVYDSLFPRPTKRPTGSPAG